MSWVKISINWGDCCDHAHHCHSRAADWVLICIGRQGTSAECDCVHVCRRTSSTISYTLLQFHRWWEGIWMSPCSVGVCVDSIIRESCMKYRRENMTRMTPSDAQWIKHKGMANGGRRTISMMRWRCSNQCKNIRNHRSWATVTAWDSGDGTAELGCQIMGNDYEEGWIAWRMRVSNKCHGGHDDADCGRNGDFLW